MQRRILALFGCALAFGPFNSARAAYPERPIRFIFGVAAGGTSDIIARLAAQELSAVLGQPVPVENRPGAGGNVAFEAAARAEVD
jgi:tripartite-type tricarboxylate transporter receptor subunit TctC